MILVGWQLPLPPGDNDRARSCSEGNATRNEGACSSTRNVRTRTARDTAATFSIMVEAPASSYYQAEVAGLGIFIVGSRTANPGLERPYRFLVGCGKRCWRLCRRLRSRDWLSLFQPRVSRTRCIMVSFCRRAAARGTASSGAALFGMEPCGALLYCYRAYNGMGCYPGLYSEGRCARDTNATG